ncbi:Gfo/Idh/MocA family protein [Amycolatopsis viridis]|uniref:Dehydrogenase n=1 Tax=Amycolatopsis viridis TaxID=185678 RepID=A0ABX0SSL3_9PSEU|nr:Gfo/Idh/MocA family oxidoreductase [Amycolatopsis viridis]NIH78475.1 putative dehydrogenase [Amycolatopsis viridis]
MTGIGLVGCGAISGAYLETISVRPELTLVGCTDLIAERAERVSAAHGVPALDGAELLAHPDVDIVLNLTNPAAHAEVSLAALAAGKHTYVEKPLATDRAEARSVLDSARAAGLRVGVAPDTFLGPGIQTCRDLIDRGVIGEPVGATVAFSCPGHELWHPDPGFYYRRGAGPLYDMGPYYLTAIIVLLGPVRAVRAADRTTHARRTIATGPRAGGAIDVEVPTYVTAILELASGPLVSCLLTFDVTASRLPHIEIHGTDATLEVPDPDKFDGPVRLGTGPTAVWRTVAPLAGLPTGRGTGLADLADAIAAGRPHRTGSEMAYHVLDIMCGIGEAARTGNRVELASRCARPAPVAARGGS